jgi:hypothetical protein
MTSTRGGAVQFFFFFFFEEPRSRAGDSNPNPLAILRDPTIVTRCRLCRLRPCLLGGIASMDSITRSITVVDI